MKKRALAPILLAAAGGWALLCWPVTVLELSNEASGVATRFRLGAGKRFSVTYHHSMYDQAVSEDFAAGPGGALILTGVRSRSGAVLQYFGFQDGRERQEVRRVMGTIVFRVAAGAAQRLTIGETQISFLDFGDHGDRLAVRAVSLPLGAHALGILSESYRDAAARRSRRIP